VAFIGDIDLSGFGPYYGDQTSSLQDFRDTLARLKDIPARVWVTSHHRGIYTERHRFLDDLATYTSKLEIREQRLLDLIRQQPRTLDELAALGVLYKPDTEIIWAPAAERRTIAQHLQEMTAAKTVTADAAGRFFITRA
jgi:hypothetical protein